MDFYQSLLSIKFLEGISIDYSSYRGIQRDPSFDLDVITMQSTLSARSVATLAVLIPLSGSIMETTLSILFSLPRGSWQRHTAFATPSLYNNGYLLALNQMR